MENNGKILKRLIIVFLALCVVTTTTVIFLTQTSTGAKLRAYIKDSVEATVATVQKVGVEGTSLVKKVKSNIDEVNIVQAVIRRGITGIWNNPDTTTREVYHRLQNTSKTLQHNKETEQVKQTGEELDSVLNAYRQNRLEDFKKEIEGATEKTLISYLTLAIDEQRDEFIDVIIKKMPDDWNADEIAEDLVKNHSVHSLSYLIDYTSPKKYPGWMNDGIDNGDADIVSMMYKKLPGTDVKSQAKKVYKNIRKAKTDMGKLRYAGVFEVFRPDLPKSTVKSYYDRAVKDNETVFVKYMKCKLYRKA